MTLSRRAILTVLGIWLFIIATVAGLVSMRDTDANRSEMSSDAQPRTLTARWPAAALQDVRLVATSGAVTLTTGDTDEVDVSVEVRPARRTNAFFSRGSGDPAAVELMHEETGTQTTLRVSDAGGPVEEHWTVRVPKRFGVRATLGTGRMRVSGVEGALDLDVSVGTVSAESGSTTHGTVDVRSDVGDAQLTLAGRSIVAPREPGPGHRLRLDGDGPHALKLRVSVGDAILHIR
jgi:hypothetical protein